MTDNVSSGSAGSFPDPIPFIDLMAQQRRLGDRLSVAVQRVMESGRFIMGPAVAALEDKLAAYVGRQYALACGSGTDALLLALMARGIGPGDAVLVPTFTFAATAEVVALAGATPVFVDVLPDTFNMDPAGLEAAVAHTKTLNLNPVAVIPVDLFGIPAAYPAIEAVARQHDLFVLQDAAQSMGGRSENTRAGAHGDAAATSFFPAKPLGCYGDGGAVFTDDPDMDAVLRSLRVHGQGSDKYDNVRIGLNARMDTIQAAILIEKLAVLDDENAARQTVAGRYVDALQNHVTTPTVPGGCLSAWAQYTILTENRDAVAAALKDQGVPTAIYYPIPLHLQTAYRAYPRAPGGLPVAEELAGCVLSLPMHPYLEPDAQDYICEAVIAAVGGGGN